MFKQRLRAPSPASYALTTRASVPAPSSRSRSAITSAISRSLTTPAGTHASGHRTTRRRRGASPPRSRRPPATATAAMRQPPHPRAARPERYRTRSTRRPNERSGGGLAAPGRGRPPTAPGRAPPRQTARRSSRAPLPSPPRSPRALPSAKSTPSAGRRFRRAAQRKPRFQVRVLSRSHIRRGAGSRAATPRPRRGRWVRGRGLRSTPSGTPVRARSSSTPGRRCRCLARRC
jgi:hypothetical protein